MLLKTYIDFVYNISDDSNSGMPTYQQATHSTPLPKKDGKEDSLTMDELEQQQQELLAKLAAVDSDDPGSNSQDTDVEQDDSSFFTPKAFHRSISKARSFGTPIVPEVKYDLDLPSAENFSKNVTEHIPYENLPNATGMYMKMRQVLQDIRDKKKDMENS